MRGALDLSLNASGFPMGDGGSRIQAYHDHLLQAPGLPIVHGGSLVDSMDTLFGHSVHPGGSAVPTTNFLHLRWDLL